MSKHYIAVLAIAVAISTSIGFTSAQASGGFRRCGNVPHKGIFHVKAQRVGCSKAKRVARAYTYKISPATGPNVDVLGFHCRRTGSYSDGGWYRCARDGGFREVRFLRGG